MPLCFEKNMTIKIDVRGENGMLDIRNERKEDYSIVEEITRKAFYNVYVPGCMEHYLVHVMRDHEDFIPELDFVLERDGQVIGNIMYTKAKLTDEDGTEKEMLQSFDQLLFNLFQPRQERPVLGAGGEILIQRVDTQGGIVHSHRNGARGNGDRVCQHGFADVGLQLAVKEYQPGFQLLQAGAQDNPDHVQVRLDDLLEQQRKIRQ